MYVKTIDKIEIRNRIYSFDSGSLWTPGITSAQYYTRINREQCKREECLLDAEKVIRTPDMISSLIDIK